MGINTHSLTYMRTLLKTVFLSDRWKYRIARHSLLWMSLLVIFTVIYHDRQGADGSLWQAFGQVGLNSLFFVGYAYVTVFLLIPVILEKRRILLFVVLFLLSGFVISWMKLSVSETVFFQAIDPMQPLAGNGLPWGALVTNTKDMTFVVALFIIARYSRENYMVRQNLHELRHRHLESEIRLLRNQMDPHVIFNNLNNMYALSLRDPGRIAPHLRQFRFVLFMKIRPRQSRFDEQWPDQVNRYSCSENGNKHGSKLKPERQGEPPFQTEYL